MDNTDAPFCDFAKFILDLNQLLIKIIENQQVNL